MIKIPAVFNAEQHTAMQALTARREQTKIFIGYAVENYEQYLYSEQARGRPKNYDEAVECGSIKQLLVDEQIVEAWGRMRKLCEVQPAEKFPIVWKNLSQAAAQMMLS